MEVKNVEYFHIHRIGSFTPLWSAGNRISWVQKRKNQFYEYYNRNGAFYNDGKGPLVFCAALERFLSSPQATNLDQAINIIKAASAIVKQQSMFIREQIFEEVRSNYFPHLPSRQTCVWVCTKDAVPFWWHTLSDSPCKILKLKLTGSLFIADQRHLVADTYPHDDLRVKAFDYWTGCDGLNIENQEILFEGIIDVIQEYADLDIFTRA